MMTNEPGTLLPPGVNTGECPANGDCSVCPISDKCAKLATLRTYEGLLPAMYNVSAPRPAQGAQGGDKGGTLLPPGVE